METAVYLAPNLTQLLAHGLNLDRVFLPVSQEADEKAREDRLAEESHVCMRRKHAVLVKSSHSRFRELWEEERQLALAAQDAVMNVPDWPEKLADRIKENTPQHLQALCARAAIQKVAHLLFNGGDRGH